LKLSNKINKFLEWTRRIFFGFGKQYNYVGFNVSILHKANGMIRILDGLCIERKGKNNGLLQSSIVLRRNMENFFVYVRIFIHACSRNSLKKLGFSFKKKKIVFSKISRIREF